ncbi:MAG: hypothetical protein COY80_00090 [Candidatus Pacebacteria bacterium CG_4_10_14_0_8_um_filter_42_14]|nr:MAG: hypothetical protein COY80_00090 [Candidatus Pacebacteria bacterium CG_4_10_14_0_8_um_filter_42_14]
MNKEKEPSIRFGAIAVVIGPDGQFVFFDSHAENGNKLDWDGEKYRPVNDNLEMVSGANNDSLFAQDDAIITLLREVKEERGIEINRDQISSRIGWISAHQQRGDEVLAFNTSVHILRVTQEQLDRISQNGSEIISMSKEEALIALENNKSAFRPSVREAIKLVLQN